MALEFGVLDTDNDGGSFDLEVEYDPAFVVPSLIEFDLEFIAATATMGIATAANSESTLRTQILRFEVDGVEAPAGASAEVPSSILIPSSAVGNPASQVSALELDISFPEMDGEEVYRWQSAEVAIQFIMEANADPSIKSDALVTVMAFTNTNPETQPLSESDGQTTPGFEAVLILSILGLALALRRRTQ